MHELSTLTTLEQKRAISAQFLNSVRPGVRVGQFSLPRAAFDPSNTIHLASYHSFLTTGNWGDVQFHTEFPYLSVTETVMRKFALYFLANQLGY